MSIQEKIHEQLDMTKERKQLDLSKRRVGVNPRNYSLIIGLGGTGVDALVEAKGLIQLTCEDSDSHVCYLGIDTSATDLKNAKSSAATGKVGLEEHGEQCLLRSNGLGSFLAPAFIQTSYRTSPEIFDWIDERITPTDADTGAGGIRQIGRLILTKRDNFIAVRQAIEDAVTDLARSATGDNSKLNVYIMAGISGGTGSGTFIDMAYLIRKVLNESANFAAEGNSIFGYLFMPDINTTALSSQVKAGLERNAYAALQELDYNLSIQDLQENYDIKWGTDKVKPGTTPEPIFNQIHLVSATDAAGHLLPNPRGTAVAAIAQNILSFVADECPSDDGDKNAQVFAMSSHYSNIDNQITNYLTANQRFPHRSARYLAIGSYDFKLPIDDIMMYITSMLFERMDKMYQKDPSDQEHTEAERQIGILYEQMLAYYRNCIPFLRSVPVTDTKKMETDYEQKGRQIIAAVSNDVNYRAQVTKAEQQLVEAITKAFDAMMKSIFQDDNKGPVFANRLIVKASKGLADRIAALHDALLFPANMENQLYAKQIAACRKAKDNLGGLFGKEEKIASYNAAGQKLLNCFTLYALAPSICRVYEKVLSYIQGQNSIIYDFVSTTLVELKEIFSTNAGILTNTEETVTAKGKSFCWERITIPQIDKLLKEKFDAVYNQDGCNLLKDFEMSLWEEALVWMGSDDKYDPKAFVSKFINDKFADLATMTIEDVVKELLAPGQTETDAWEKLFQKIQEESRPLFHAKEKDKVGGTQTLISIPESCPNLFKYITAKAKAIGSSITVQKTKVSDRIYAQTVQCGITLSNYQIVENAEKSYALLRGTPGAHLIAPAGKYAPKDPVSWMEMSTLIPGYLRSDKEIMEENVRKLVEEEEGKKAEIKNLCEVSETGIVSKSPAIECSEDTSGVFELRLIVTDAKVERFEDIFGNPKLRITVGGKSEEFGFNTQFVESKLSTILEKGKGLSRFATGTPAVSAKTKVITFRQPLANHYDETLDYLTEQYITAIGNRHEFLNELAKYAVIQEFMDAKKARDTEILEQKKRIEAFARLQIMQRVAIRPGFKAMGELVSKKGGRLEFGMPLPACQEEYEKQYYLFDCFYACYDNKTVPGDSLEHNAIQREKRRVTFVNLSNGAADEFNAQLSDVTSVQDLLNKTTAKKNEVAAILMRREIMDTLEGVKEVVPIKMAEYFLMLDEVLGMMIDALNYELQSLGVTTSTTVAASDVSTMATGPDFSDFE